MIQGTYPSFVDGGKALGRKIVVRTMGRAFEGGILQTGEDRPIAARWAVVRGEWLAVWWCGWRNKHRPELTAGRRCNCVSHITG